MMQVRTRHGWCALAAVLVVLAGCAPRARPLEGTRVSPAQLPSPTVGDGPRLVSFRWEASDPELVVRGEGAARVAPPDSARLDFFLAGGLGGGRAVLIGDSLQVPGSRELVERLVPPPPLLWGALGRLAVPVTADTVVTRDGPTVRADFGRPAIWRVTFRGDSLVRVERIAGGRIAEWVERSGTEVRYRDESARRELRLTITRSQPSPPFDASIWRP